MLSSAFLRYSLTAVGKSVGFQLSLLSYGMSEKETYFCKIIQMKAKLGISSSFYYYFFILIIIHIVF